jgi:hypothetical protein
MMHGIMKEYRRFFITVLALLGIMVMVVNYARDQTKLPAPTPRLSDQRITHILYGDKTGGGHLHGVGKPCKSEFPADWSAEDIINTIRTQAANDNINWRKGDNGYHAGEVTVNNLRVRIVLDREMDDVVTAYPVNVKRNACD